MTRVERAAFTIRASVIRHCFDLRISTFDITKKMGIDLLDIAFRIEKSFGVRFDVRELLGDWTGEPPPLGPSIKVGDVYELILEKRKALNLPEGAGRLESLALADVRLALSRVLDVSPDTIRPEDRLSRLLPLKQRRRQWRRLRRQLKGLGPLKRRRTAFRGARWGGLFAVMGIAIVGLGYTGILPVGHPAWWIAWPVLVLSGYVGGAFALNALGDLGMAKRIPWEARTVELLARTHLARNRRSYLDRGGTDSDEDVWYTLQVIIADALAVDVKEVTREADLVRDLGAD